MSQVPTVQRIKETGQANQPEPSPRLEPLSFSEARKAAQDITKARRLAVEDLQRAADQRAGSEVRYHKAKATAMVKLRSEGAGATEASELVKGEVADELLQREVAINAVEIIREKLKSIDGERASLHRLIEWSQRLGLDE